MPILRVEIVGKPAAGAGNLAKRIADAAAGVLKAPPGRVWVRLSYLPHGNYAECGASLTAGIRPVFVNLLKARLGPQKALLMEARAMAKAIAKACARPVENVHIFYDPPALGRAAFGGELLEKKRTNRG